ncbi:MAG: GTP cyclohydrolase I FolE [Duncaniella sp.]|uniref:GTP cyclohydrolase I FolE n=1 Tax=Duncaniella sp. TaxID=2518496 RepID=UPI0023BE70E0|nr:GTP cyclohydrolase I FolE [Duncaniella sp.]MDE6089264.1 GTP cyclohydrolase I FolE [Duncaniella sp.]
MKELSEDTIKEIASHYEAIIRLLGEDVEREGLIKTPMRAAKAMAYVTRGYRQDADELINGAIFSYEGSRMVVVKDIEFHSLCEHHILPFFGKVSIGYIPDGKTIGLSKLARLVDFYARRLQVQERMTAQICKIVMEKLGAKGVIVICTGEHLCMKMRGVEKQNSSTTTIETAGVFEESAALREEFFNTLRH